MKTKIICGIEVEMLYNSQLLDLDTGSYHEESYDHPLGEYFNIESDGSLRRTMNHPQTAEIVSSPFIIDDWEKVIDDFRNSIQDISGMDGMGEIAFNESCGAHIHLTILNADKGVYNVSYKGLNSHFKGKPLNIKKLYNVKFFNRIAKRLKERVKNEMGESFYNLWITNYNRNYARRITKRNIINKRYLEWNMQPNGEEIEFRSFHLLGVKTWEDFKKMYKIAFETLRDEIQKEIDKPKPLRMLRRIKIKTNVNDKIEIDCEPINQKVICYV